MTELKSGSVERQIVVLAGLEGKVSASIEKSLIDLLDTDNETLELQTIQCLGRVGSHACLEALLLRIDSRSRDIRDAAANTLGTITGKQIDALLQKKLSSGSPEDRILAIKALSLRAGPGISELVNTYAADESIDDELREVAISSMELVGDVESFQILVNIILAEEESGLRKTAQKTLKRMSLRLADPDAAWLALNSGLRASSGDIETMLALLIICDSAPSKSAIEYLKCIWGEGDPRIQKMILRVLPIWRNWDGGFALLELANLDPGNAAIRQQCFKGIGKLILGSDATFPISVKFDLAAIALEQADSPDERSAVISGFRYSTWRERVHVTYNDVAPDLKEAVLQYAKD